jgi:hypothetical protein
MMPAIAAGMSRVPADLVATGSAINNIVQRVAGSFGLAALTAVLVRQEAVHSVYLSSVYTPVSRTLQNVIRVMSQQLATTGISPFDEKILSLTLIHSQVLETAFVMALDDVFVLAMAITLLGIIFAIFLQSYHQAPIATKSRAPLAAPGAKDSKTVQDTSAMADKSRSAS